jgi:hypothetical protein
MRSYRASRAVCAAALLLAACGGDTGPTGPTEPPETAAADAAQDDGSEDAGDDVVEADDTGDGELEPDADRELTTGPGDDSADGSSTPEDVSLDLTQRHPNGTVLQVTNLAFEGNTILVDAEFVNGATRAVRLRIEGAERLRLSDDLGNAYNFLAPDDLDGDRIELAVSESIGGTFAFLGPVDPDAGDLTLGVNVPDPMDGFALDGRREETQDPEFVLEGLDLRW